MPWDHHAGHRSIGDIVKLSNLGSQGVNWSTGGRWFCRRRAAPDLTTQACWKANISGARGVGIQQDPFCLGRACRIVDIDNDLQYFAQGKPALHLPKGTGVFKVLYEYSVR